MLLRQPAKRVPTKELKPGHEQAVCEIFLSKYNEEFGSNYKFLRLGTPPEPDCIFSEDLSVEIYTAYYNEKEARDQWELARQEINIKEYNDRREMISNPDQQIFDSIDKGILEKIASNYSYSGKIFLVIDVEAPILSYQEVQDKYLSIPKDFPNNFFDEIWIYIRDSSEIKIAKVL